MYSKTRNTLTALTAASLIVVAGWLIGSPVNAFDASQGVTPAQLSIMGATAQVSNDTSAWHSRHSNRMSLAMPYYSFSLALPQRRAD